MSYVFHLTSKVIAVIISYPTVPCKCNLDQHRKFGICLARGQRLFVAFYLFLSLPFFLSFPHASECLFLTGLADWLTDWLTDRPVDYLNDVLFANSQIDRRNIFSCGILQTTQKTKRKNTIKTDILVRLVCGKASGGFRWCAAVQYLHWHNLYPTATVFIMFSRYLKIKINCWNDAFSSSIAYGWGPLSFVQFFIFFLLPSLFFLLFFSYTVN